MVKLENKTMSIFSAETLDSIAMAELCGGMENSNDGVNIICINTSEDCNIVAPNTKCP